MSDPIDDLLSQLKDDQSELHKAIDEELRELLDELHKAIQSQSQNEGE